MVFPSLAAPCQCELHWSEEAPDTLCDLTVFQHFAVIFTLILPIIVNTVVDLPTNNLVDLLTLVTHKPFLAASCMGDFSR